MPIFLNSSGFFRGSSMTSCSSVLCSSNPPIDSQIVCGFSTITNFSTSKLFLLVIFFIIVRFFCSASTESPGRRGFSQLDDTLTRNSFPFGSLTSASCPIKSLTSHIINGVFLNFSSSFCRLSACSFRNLFSSSRSLICVT